MGMIKKFNEYKTDEISDLKKSFDSLSQVICIKIEKLQATTACEIIDEVIGFIDGIKKSNKIDQSDKTELLEWIKNKVYLFESRARRHNVINIMRNKIDELFNCI